MLFMYTDTVVHHENIYYIQLLTLYDIDSLHFSEETSNIP
jgi:hypothetical protein